MPKIEEKWKRELARGSDQISNNEEYLRRLTMTSLILAGKLSAKGMNHEAATLAEALKENGVESPELDHIISIKDKRIQG